MYLTVCCRYELLIIEDSQYDAEPKHMNKTHVRMFFQMVFSLYKVPLP